MDKSLLGRLAAWKLLAFLIIGACLASFPKGFNSDNFFGNFHWPEDQAVTRSTELKTWDAQHYLYLSRIGYQPGSDSNNFYPLWPLAIRLGSIFFLGHGLLAALALSNLFAIGAVLLFHAYARMRHGPEIAGTATLFLLAFPGAIFLHIAYSESLFLFLCMLLFYCLLEERWGVAALAAFLLPLARPQGLMVTAPLWWALWERRRKAAWFCWLAPLAGFGAYLFFMSLSTGNAFEGFATAARLYRPTPSVMRLFDLPGFLSSLFRATSFHDYGGSLLDRSWIVVLGFCLPLLWRKDKLYFIYALALGFASAATMSFVSYTRYFLLVFPAFIVMGEYFSGKGRDWPRRAVLSVFAALQGFLLWRQALNDWAG